MPQLRKVNVHLKSGAGGSRFGPSVDHVVARSKGGTDDLDNLALTHWICNVRKGNRPIEQFTPPDDIDEAAVAS